jgi:ATP-binding cassette subfamily B protein/subfamily B ATP-binding cassette protein MsbA
MRQFLRVLRYSWAYRYRLLLSVCCALFVAALWSLNLSAIYPVLNILNSGKNLHQWVDGEIEEYQKKLDDPARKALLARRKEELRNLDAVPNLSETERDDLERKATQKIAKLEGENNHYGTWLYRYQLLKAKVIRHLPEDRFEQIVWIMAAVVVGVFLRGIFEFIHEALVGNVTFRTLFDLRNAFFHRAIHQDVHQLAGTGTTDLMARFTNDTEQVGVGLKVLFGKMVGEPLKAIACLVAACCISWQLTLVFVLLVPVAGYILVRVAKLMRRAVKKVLEQMSTMYKLVRETFDSIRVAKAFTRESRERRKFRAASREYLRKAMRMIYIDAATGPIFEVLLVLAVGLALASGTYLVVSGSTHIWGMRMTSEPLTFPMLLQLYAFLVATADPVRRLSSVYTKLQAGEAAAARVFEIFDRRARVRPNPDGPRLDEVRARRSAKREAARAELTATLGRAPRPEELAARLGIPREQLDVFIEFRHVCFAYNADNSDSPTLDNVCLTVKAGEVIAVVGGNGSGKTTLLGLLPRFYDPDSGAVLIDGVNLRAAHLRSLRKLIGLVTQDTQLFDDSVLANIAYGNKGATREEVIEAAKKAHAHDFIAAKPEGYESRMGDAGANFSGGEKQKIALARAILRDPRILILDEFTSAIDSASEADIHDVLREFVKGRTVFLITHKLHTLEIADRIVVMDAGRIVDVGTHGELIGRCTQYQRLVDPGAGRMAA